MQSERPEATEELKVGQPPARRDAAQPPADLLPAVEAARNRTRPATLDPGLTLRDALSLLEQSGVSTGVVVENGRRIGRLALGPDADARRTAAPFSADGLDAELRLAKKIQQQLLPRAIPQVPGLQVFGTLVSARDVGGDYWSCKYYRPDHCVTLKLADVTGHGIAAALLVPAVKYISGGFYRGASGPAWVMQRTNHVLVKETPVEILVSMVYAWYDTRSRILKVVNAGHRPAFLVKSGQLVEIPPTGPVLGLIETEFECDEYRLDPGDLFFVCSDGITEAGTGSQRFGEERVEQIVLALRDQSPQKIAAAVLAACSRESGTPQDDRSILIARGTPVVSVPVGASP